MKRLFMFVVLLGLAVTLAPAAELTTGTLDGTAKDEDGNPVAGAIVTLMGPQGVKTSTTNDRGKFNFRGLTSGTYKVKVEAANFAPMVQTDVNISINTTTQLPFVLTKGMTEEITVVSQAPIVDLKSTGTGATIKIDDFAPYVPLGRNLTAVFSIAPGVADGGGVLGSTNTSISGSSGLENAYFVDGVNITNSGYGALGAYSIVYGSLGTGVTYDFLEEVQVKTGGFEAEFGQAGGGVVNSVVRTGTNRFGFDVSWYERSFVDTHGDRLDSPNRANEHDTLRRDISVTANGPILKDKLFYFVAYNPITIEQDFRLTSGDGTNDYFLSDTNSDGLICDEDNSGSCFDPAGPSGGPETVLNPGVLADTPSNFAVGDTVSGGRVPSSVTREREIENYAAKVSWFLTPNHKLEATAFGDPSDGEEGPQNPTSFLNNLTDPVAIPDATTGATGLDWGGDQLALKYQGVWTSNFFTEIQVSHKENTFSEIGSGVNFRSFLDVDTNNNFGGAGFYEDLSDEVDQITLKNTHVFGPVELSYGWQQEDIEWAQPRLRSGDPYAAFFPIMVDGDVGGGASSGFVPTCTDPTDFSFIDSDGDGIPDDPNAITTTGCYQVVVSSTGATVDIVPPTGPTPETFNVTRTVFTEVGQPTDAEERNAFLQATWSVLPSLTLNLGARWTEQELTGAGNETLALGILSDGSTVGAPAAGAVPQTTLTAQTYKFDSEIAPRIGVSWDVRNNGKHKLYANWGEYYQRIPSDLAVRAFSNEVGTTDEIFLDGGLTTPFLNATCGVDSAPGVDGNGDGIVDNDFDITVLCHQAGNIQGLAGGGSIILDGTQLDPNSTVFAALGGLHTLTSGSATALPFTEETLAGYAWEINDYTGVEIRYIHREIGRVLEDVQFASNEQTWNLFFGAAGGNNSFGDPFTGHGSGAFGAYVFANVGDNVSTDLFPLPARDYDALEFIFTRRFHNNWMAYVNYRYATLEGIYEGSFRNDNGQSDPFLTSLFDFPATSALDSDPLVDGNGDGILDNDFDTFIQSDTLFGQYIEGPLNTERRHIFNGFMSKQFDFGLNIGGRLNIQTGQPRGPLFAHPTYRNAGEVPGNNAEYWWGVGVDNAVGVDATALLDGCTPFNLPGGDVWCEDGILDNDFMGEGFVTNPDSTFDVDGILGNNGLGGGDQSTDFDGDGTNDAIMAEATGPRLFSYDFVKRDFFGRTPTIVTFDVNLSYDIALRDSKSKLTLMVDVFNVFNDNEAIRFDNTVENRPGSDNPDFLKANLFQGPRFFRLGAKFTW